MLLRHAVLSVCGGLALFWVVGCSSSSAGAGTDAGGGADSFGGTSTDQACTDSAHAICTQMQTCEPSNIQTVYGDEATCETRLKSSCVDSLAAPSTGATPAQTEACAQAYPGISCTDYVNKTNIPAACTQVTGPVATGAACVFPAQCQTGFCAIVPGSACGTCASPPKQGDSCAAVTSCGPTLTCTNDTLVCTTVAAPNQPCGKGQPCGTGLSCVAMGGVGTPGTCQPSGAKVGATCDGSFKTGPSCNNSLNLYCDGKTKQCAQTTYAATGACGYDATTGTLVECTAGSCQSGQCAARAADNGACSVSDGGAATPSMGCLPPSHCIGGTCQTATGSGCH